MVVERLSLRSRHEPLEIIAWRAMAIGGLAVLGGILRVYGARGDLWLDEIWSLALLEPVKSFGEIIWGINSDNNHVLNSMYLYLVGPNAASILLRGMSIVLGIASVAAAGLILRRDGIIGALCAMLLFAVSYPVVHYGSEARGYSGLILFALLSLFLLQRELRQASWINRQGFGLAVGLGLLSHLSMAVPAAAFGIWTIFAIWRRTASLGEAVVNGFFIFLPALIWTMAVAGSVGYVALRYGFVVSAYSVPDKFAIGGLGPFEFTGAVNAFGELIRLTVGLPDSVPAAVCFVGAMTLIVASAPLWRDRDNRRFSLYVISVIILPTAVLAARLPNTQFPRYFLFSGIMFLLFIADVVTNTFLRGGLYRSAAALTLTAIVCGNAISLYHFFHEGRGHYAMAVGEMIENGWIVYGSDHDFRTPMVVDFYSHKLGVQPDYIRIRDWCTDHPPDWYVVESPDDPILAYTLAVLTFPRCTLRFRRTDTFSYWGLSGRQWVLYRRVG